MRLLLKILGWLLALVAVLALALGGGGYLWLRRSLPQTSGSLRVPGLTAPITITRDANAIPHISAQSEADVQLVVRVGRHGPLISDVADDGAAPLAFRWTALDPEDTTLRAFLALNRAQGWPEFTEALRSYHAPMQNFVYADVDGNIGYYAPGAVPIRLRGDGRLPCGRPQAALQPQRAKWGRRLHRERGPRAAHRALSPVPRAILPPADRHGRPERLALYADHGPVG